MPPPSLVDCLAGVRSTTLPDITHLIDAERKVRQRKKCRRSAQQVQAELRMYARYVNEERRMGCPFDLTP